MTLFDKKACGKFRDQSATIQRKRTQLKNIDQLEYMLNICQTLLSYPVNLLLN